MQGVSHKHPDDPAGVSSARPASLAPTVPVLPAADTPPPPPPPRPATVRTTCLLIVHQGSRQQLCKEGAVSAEGGSMEARHGNI